MTSIAGPEATSVTLTWRSRDGRRHNANLERALVPPETVFTQRLAEVLVIQVTAFNHSTDTHLARAIEQGLANLHTPAGIVLDLRGNRGGVLRQAVTAADALLPAGIVAITAGRDPEGKPHLAIQRRRTRARNSVVVSWMAAPQAPRKSWRPRWPTAGRGVVIGSSTLARARADDHTTA